MISVEPVARSKKPKITNQNNLRFVIMFFILQFSVTKNVIYEEIWRE